MLGSFPGVTGGLDPAGNLKPTADFRAVYAALLEQWLDADANAILPGVARVQAPDAAEVRLLAAAAALVVCSPAPHRPGGAPAPARVQVTAKEFFFALSRRTVGRGARRSSSS